MTAVGCDPAEFNPPHHAIRQREKSGLVRAAKKEPGRVTVASAGIGSFPHVFAEVFESLVGLQLTHVLCVPKTLSGLVERRIG